MMPNIDCHKVRVFPKNPNAPTSSRYLVKRVCRPRKMLKHMRVKPSVWQDMLNEERELQNYVKLEQIKNLPTFECESSYCRCSLFPVLIPAFELVCVLTLNLCAHCKPVQFFDFIDILSEVLYNHNPTRRGKIPWTSAHVVFDTTGRKYYPYHLFISEDEAATMIQAWWRGIITRRLYNLKELREQREKMKVNAEKQRKCFEAYKDQFLGLHRCFPEGTKH